MTWRHVAGLAVLLAASGCGTRAAAPAAPTPAATPAAVDAAASAPVVLVAPERLSSTGVRGPVAVAVEPRFVSALASDYCVDRDLPAPKSTHMALTILDRTYALSSAHAPSDLVPASQAGFGGTSGAKLVSAAIIDDLAAMRVAWAGAGLTITIDSAYRSYATQASTFNSWVSRSGLANALVRSARPGHSEHQLGTTLDLTSAGWNGRFGNWATETAEGRWLAEHAWRYGFVMSYPLGSQEATCFSYEPWHYRWIGRDAAAAHRASGLHLRPFLERFVDG